MRFIESASSLAPVNEGKTRLPVRRSSILNGRAEPWHSPPRSQQFSDFQPVFPRLSRGITRQHLADARVPSIAARRGFNNSTKYRTNDTLGDEPSQRAWKRQLQKKKDHFPNEISTIRADFETCRWMNCLRVTTQERLEALSTLAASPFLSSCDSSSRHFLLLLVSSPRSYPLDHVLSLSLSRLLSLCQASDCRIYGSLISRRLVFSRITCTAAV